MSMDNNAAVETSLNRRDFFKRAAVLGVAVAGAGTLLAACKQPDTSGAQQAAGGSAPAAQGSAPAGGDGELNCMSTEGLEPAQIKVRESLQYVDKTPKADQDCANCIHFKPDANGGCGGCAVVPGPIHPKGWCTAWVAQG